MPTVLFVIPCRSVVTTCTSGSRSDQGPVEAPSLMSCLVHPETSCGRSPKDEQVVRVDPG